MKLYYAPGACSLAPHIALREAGVHFEIERVDLKTKITESGTDFRDVTVKGYVPALVLERGAVITENLAVLDYIAGREPSLGVDGPLGRTRLIEALTYVTTELHKSYKPFFKGGSEAERAVASEYITRRMRYLADTIAGDYLFGERPSVADFYLLVMMRWAGRFDIALPEPLAGLRLRLEARPSVRAALAAESGG